MARRAVETHRHQNSPQHSRASTGCRSIPPPGARLRMNLSIGLILVPMLVCFAGYFGAAPGKGFSQEPSGLAEFLAEPDAFGLECGADVGRVVSAELIGEELTIHYTFPTHHGAHAGVAHGTIRGSHFEGRDDQGPVALRFHVDGTAHGTWGEPIRDVRIFRPVTH
ncbi:MAG: hypothetical protein AAGF12_13395 [Myxococcota bacterium]